MGLDMYLTGDRYRTETREIGQLKAERYHLGHWRKHHQLHSFIVQNFDNGDDSCHEIDLGLDELHLLLEAIVNRELPHTTGFFFGESDVSDEQIAEDVKTIEQAIRWVETDDPGHWRSVVYQASW